MPTDFCWPLSVTEDIDDVDDDDEDSDDDDVTFAIKLNPLIFFFFFFPRHILGDLVIDRHQYHGYDVIKLLILCLLTFL